MILLTRSSVSACVIGLALCFGGGSVIAACYSPDQQLPVQTVNDFLGNSNRLLQDSKNAEGGADMIAHVRDLVASSPTALPLVIALLATANPAQQTAIGTGLGQAAGLCIRSDPAYAADIQAQLAGSPSENAKTAYAAVTGNQPIRSVAGGGGVSGGSSGGSTGSIGTPTANSSTVTAFSANSVLGSSTNYFTGSTTGASGSSGSAAASTSVSP